MIFSGSYHVIRSPVQMAHLSIWYLTVPMLAFSVVLNSTNGKPIMSLNPAPCAAIPERATGASPACAADAIPARHGADLQRSRRAAARSEEHTSELQSRENLVC